MNNCFGGPLCIDNSQSSKRAIGIGCNCWQFLRLETAKNEYKLSTCVSFNFHLPSFVVANRTIMKETTETEVVRDVPRCIYQSNDRPTGVQIVTPPKPSWNSMPINAYYTKGTCFSLRNTQKYMIMINLPFEKFKNKQVPLKLWAGVQSPLSQLNFLLLQYYWVPYLTDLS